MSRFVVDLLASRHVCLEVCSGALRTFAQLAAFSWTEAGCKRFARRGGGFGHWRELQRKSGASRNAFGSCASSRTA